MIRRVWSELKIMGADFLILSAAFTAAIILLSAAAGELLPFYPVSFKYFFLFMRQSPWGNGERHGQTAILISLPHKAVPCSGGCCCAM